MAKGKGKLKKDKKGKKSKKQLAVAESDNGEPDPNVKCSEGEFTFPNADVYIGEFCAHRQGLIWREGKGVYKTKDGQEYDGKWHNDKLVEDTPVEIRYPEGHTFVGIVARDKYNGPGTYYCSDVKISCNFENNKPQGNIALIDPLGDVYVGDARETSATLVPVNVLFNYINPTRGILHDSTFVTDLTDVESGITCMASEHAYDLHQKDTVITWKDVIFARSKKTDPRMFFDESDWYKDWLKFKRIKERIKSGVPSNEEHDDAASCDDEQWLHEYEQYKQLRQVPPMTDTSSKELIEKNELLTIFNSSAYANSCPVVQVIYPSSEWNTFNSANDLEDRKDELDEDNVKNTPESIANILRLFDASTPHEPRPKITSKSETKTSAKNKCLDRRNFGGGTNSLFDLVNSFFDNVPISSKYVPMPK